MASSTSPLLALPQELRDLIFTHAINDLLPWPQEFNEWQNEDTTTTVTTTEDTPSALHDTPSNPLIFFFPAYCPIPTWYNLLFTCRKIHHDVRQLVPPTTTSSSPKNSVPSPITNIPSAAAEIILSLTSTTSTTTWLTLPCHPSRLTSLHITIRVADLRDQSMTSGAPQADNKIIRALSTLLQQFCNRGPHFCRARELDSGPLQLNTVKLALEPGFDVQGSERFFGEATQQLATVSGVLMIWLGRLARSGLLRRRVGRITWSCGFVSEMDAKGLPLEFEVSRDVWSEDDREMFRVLGYQFD